MKRKLVTLAVILPLVLTLDLITKRWALVALADGRQLELFGGLVPLTLAFNRGAAFGISIGSDPRMLFIPITLIALILLGTLFARAEPDDRLRLLSLALVISGALGNLYDRVRWDVGVVDFLGPINLGFTDFPIFNVADMSISCGAVLLAISFWLEERDEARRAAMAPQASSDSNEAAEPVV